MVTVPLADFVVDVVRDDLLIEVQTGDYFGEDDIERFEDDYGRAGEQFELLRRRTHDRSEPWLAVVHLRLAQSLCLSSMLDWSITRPYGPKMAM